MTPGTRHRCPQHCRPQHHRSSGNDLVYEIACATTAKTQNDELSMVATSNLRPALWLRRIEDVTNIPANSRHDLTSLFVATMTATTYAPSSIHSSSFSFKYDKYNKFIRPKTRAFHCKPKLCRWNPLQGSRDKRWRLRMWQKGVGAGQVIFGRRGLRYTIKSRLLDDMVCGAPHLTRCTLKCSITWTNEMLLPVKDSDNMVVSNLILTIF